MSKNKLKFVIFIAFSFFFMFVNFTFIHASEYEANVTNLDGLVYGNKLKDVKIEGTSSVEGTFVFSNPDIVLDDVGEINIDIIFIPENEGEVKRITVTKEVVARKISIAFDTPLYKQYDGDTSLKLPNYSYVGIIDDEVSIEGELIATLSATYVSEGIGVILSGVNIIGEKSDCYYLDLLEHTARIYPSVLEKAGENATKIYLKDDVYIDISYSLKVVKKDDKDLIDNKYTSFAKYGYEVYSHNNEKLDIKGKFNISMKINESEMNKERLKLFELTKDGEYKELIYTYKDGEIKFEMDNDSYLVLSTRNIEYHFIILFSMILLFSLIFVIVYRLKNSKIIKYKQY